MDATEPTNAWLHDQFVRESIKKEMQRSLLQQMALTVDNVASFEWTEKTSEMIGHGSIKLEVNAMTKKRFPMGNQDLGKNLQTERNSLNVNIVVKRTIQRGNTL